MGRKICTGKTSGIEVSDKLKLKSVGSYPRDKAEIPPLFSNNKNMPSEETKSWQTVVMKGVGTIRVPKEWNVERQDDVLYITDKPLEYQDHTVYLAGINKLHEGVEKKERLRSDSYSNGALLKLIEYHVNGKKEEHYLITFFNDYGSTMTIFDLFVWDRDSVDEKIASEIAKTFKSEAAMQKEAKK